VGDFLGSILGFEGSMAFMLEASFLGIMMFGWERVPPVIHYLATILVAFGANLSTFWILVANSWFQTPAGGKMVNGKFIVDDYFQAILNPFMVNSVLHMFLATLETSLFVIGGISAWYILNNRHQEFFSKSFKIVLVISIFIAPLQVYIGHASGDQVYHYQPTKLAAIEAQWETVPAGESAKWNILAIPNRKAEKNDWEISIPNGLSYILELKPKLSEPVLGLKEWKPEDRPPMIPLIFYSFRIMAGIGFFLVGLMLWSILQWLRGKLSSHNLTQQKWLLRAWILAAPLGYIAIESGWIVRCVGRQPWTVYGQIRTTDAASHLPPGEVLFSLTVITLLYSVLFVCAMFFGSRIIRKGPDLTLPIPGSEIKTVIATESVSHIPDSRPLETPQ
jgi:cytochrome d ubiquinol oxidase subunit I